MLDQVSERLLDLSQKADWRPKPWAAYTRPIDGNEATPVPEKRRQRVRAYGAFAGNSFGWGAHAIA